MRRGQFEIMGLAIVVVIISIGIFFMLAFAFQPDENVTGQFLEEQFAQNTLDALMKTSLEGCKGTVSEYIVSQVTGVPLRPRVEGETPSCTTEEGMQEIVDNLGYAIEKYQGRSFIFQVRSEPCAPGGAGCDFVVNEERGCTYADNRGRPGRQLLSKYPDPEPAEVVLVICAPQ